MGKLLATINNYSDAKIIDASYDLSYSPIKLIIEFEEVNGKMLIKSINISNENKTKQISYKEKMGIININNDIYMIDYSAKADNFGEKRADNIINSFTTDTNSIEETGTKLDLSSGSGILNYNSDGNNILAVLFPRDDFGSSHIVGNFDTASSDVTNLSQTESNYVEASESLNYNSNSPKFPYGGTESNHLRKLEKENFNNHSNMNSYASSLNNFSEPQLGKKEEFNVLTDFLNGDYKKITAELKRKGDNSQIWVDTSIEIPSDNLDKLSIEFENNIYDTVQSYFGREPLESGYSVLSANGEKVNILITPLNGIGGYFSSSDLYSQDNNSNSNERKIIYINHYQEAGTDERFLDYQTGTLAHEFQHMIFYNEKIKNKDSYINGTWINEGFSQLAEDLTGFGYEQGVANKLTKFLNDPENTSLLYWGQSGKDYNISYLFARYLYDRFDAQLIKKIHTTNSDYKTAIEEYTGLKFKNLFEDFAIALWVNDSGTKYGFDSITFPKPNTEKISIGDSWTDKSINGWGISYTFIENSSGNDLKLNIDNAALNGDFWLRLID